MMGVREQINFREHLKMVARALDAAPSCGKTRLAQQHAEALGISVQTLYRRLRSDIGRESGRKVRADKGSTAVTPEAMDFIAGAQKVSWRKNGKLVMPTTTAASLAAMHGIEVGVTPGRLQQVLKARGLDAATQGQDSPAVSLRSRHPNHVHMVDPSLCLIYYLNGRQHVIREDVAYKNKPDALNKVKLKVWRYVLVDHYSHWIFVRYFEARGETQDSLFRFLIEAWSQRDGRHFHGVPKLLMMDPGSANTAHSIRNLCEAMEIQLQINLPGNPRAKGSVEVAQNIVETHFESLLRFQPVSDVAALNQAADAWCNAFNANLVPNFDSRLNRVGMTAPMARSDLWLKIKPDQLRLCPPLSVCGALMRGASVEREVTAKREIRYRHPQAEVTRTYDLRHILALNTGDMVTVRPLIYSNGAVMVEFDRYDGTKLTYRLEPNLAYDEAGQPLDAPVIGEEYKALPMTDGERAGQRLDTLAYGVDADGVIRDREAILKAKNNTTVAPFAHWCDGQGLRPLDALQGIEMPNFLPKKGVPITPKVAETKPLDSLGLEAEGSALSVPSTVQLDQDALRLCHLEMAQRLASALADNWSAALYEQMVELYPAGVVYEEMPAVIDRFKRQVLASQMRVINGGAA